MRHSTILAFGFAVIGLLSSAEAATSPIGSRNQAGANATNAATTTADCPVGSVIVLAASYATVADTLSSVSDTNGSDHWTVIDNIAGTAIGLAVAYTSVKTAADLPSSSTVTATFSGLTTSSIGLGCIATASSSTLDIHGQTSQGLTATSATSASSGTLKVPKEEIFGILATATTQGGSPSDANLVYRAGASKPLNTPSVSFFWNNTTTTASVAFAPTWTTTTNYVTDIVSIELTAGQDSLTTVGAGN